MVASDLPAIAVPLIRSQVRCASLGNHGQSRGSLGPYKQLALKRVRPLGAHRRKKRLYRCKPMNLLAVIGAPGRIRTHDPLVRSSQGALNLLILLNSLPIHLSCIRLCTEQCAMVQPLHRSLPDLPPWPDPTGPDFTKSATGSRVGERLRGRAILCGPLNRFAERNRGAAPFPRLRAPIEPGPLGAAAQISNAPRANQEKLRSLIASRPRSST
jgi:hypothetical protein